jgi:hypothetical protein
MSDSVIRAIASAITHKELTAKSTGRKFTLYTVETDHGEFTTAKRDLEQKSQRMIGQEADYTIRTEQRGDFTNYYLEEVLPVGTPPPSPSLFPQNMPKPQGQVNHPQVPEPSANTMVQQRQEQPIGNPAFPSDKDINIMRQTAGKVAGAISRTPEEFWDNIDAIVAYFIDGSKPPQYQETGMVTSNDLPGLGVETPDDSDIPF